MKSIRTKIIVLMLCAIIVSVAAVTAAGVAAVVEIGSSSSKQILSLMCQNGEKNLDAYFKSVEQSVDLVSNYVKTDLNQIPSENLSGQLSAHVDRTREIFAKAAKNTNGVLTYYYRIDPEISDTEKGFWYINSSKHGFEEHQVTEINLYDTEDTSSLVWFTVPKSTGSPIWLSPYVTETLGVRVISYNAPIYRGGVFIGVVGIEIDYSTMADQVNGIRLYDNGYAFITEQDGTLIYHPYIDVTDSAKENHPETPEGILGTASPVRYTFKGVEKQAVRQKLHNGMVLNVAVPVSELNGNWHKLVALINIISTALIVVFVVITMKITERIVKPLNELTKAAEQLNTGNYDLTLDYSGNDEVGILTRTISRLIDHLKGYIGDLNTLAYGDALTSVKNKGSFDIYMRELQEQIDSSDKKPEFAIAMFDCNDLKMVNDVYGHDKGDIYLKNTCHLICRTFRFSPVFRVGGDEFTVILKNHDYEKRDELAKYFTDRCEKMTAHAEEPWERMRIAMGIAVYDQSKGESADNVFHRADTLMYENKRELKSRDNKGGKNK